jgi:hypothetical protein
MISKDHHNGEADLQSLRMEGNKLRDVGIALAAARKPDRVTLGRINLVKALLDSPNGKATIDDATPSDELSSGFTDGGKWRGNVTRSVVQDGLARIVGITRSVRPTRHRGYIAVLQMIDRNTATEYLRAMNAQFAAFNDVTPTAGTAEVIQPNTERTTTVHGVSHHEAK